MDTADSVEQALERLMPRGMSAEGAKSLDELIDGLAAASPARPDWARIGVWSTGALAAGLALWFGARQESPRPAVAPIGSFEPPQVELVSELEGVVAVQPVGEVVAEADGTLHRGWRVQVVNEEYFHDEETGHEVRVVHPRDEIVMMPVTSF